MANCGGRFALCIAPWDRPISLTRVWCLYEIYLAVQADLEITIAMTTEGQRAWQSAMQNTSSSEMNSLCE